MKVKQVANGDRTRNVIAGNNVTIGGNSRGVIINGEKCYPSSMIKELNDAWSAATIAAADHEIDGEAWLRLRRIQRLLDLS